jgi:hypothetical protein
VGYQSLREQGDERLNGAVFVPLVCIGWHLLPLEPHTVTSACAAFCSHPIGDACGVPIPPRRKESFRVMADDRSKTDFFWRGRVLHSQPSRVSDQILSPEVGL